MDLNNENMLQALTKYCNNKTQNSKDHEWIMQKVFII